MQALLRRIGITRDEVQRLGAAGAARPRSARLGGACGPPTRPTSGATLADARFAATSTTRWQHVSVIAAANAEEEALAIAVALREALETDRQDRRAGDARPRAGAPRAGGARALERRGRRFRRRRARRHAGRRVRAARRRGGARRARAGHAAGAAQASAAAARRRRPARMRTPSRCWSRRCCAARARSPAAAGLRTRSRRSATTSQKLHRSRSAHAADAARQLQIAADLIARARRRARAARSACQAQAAARRTSPPRIAQVIEALSSERQRRRRRLRRPRWRRARPGVRGDRRQRAGRRRDRRAAGLSRPVPRHRRRASRCAGPTGRACACASTACSKRGCNRSTASCSAGWSRASGRRRRAAIPGSAGRCGTQLGLDLPERRIALVGARLRADARRARGRPRLSRAKLAGAPTVPSRFVQRLAAVAGEARWKAALRARRTLSRLGARARPAGDRPQPVARPEPKPPRDARPTRSRSPRSRPGCAIPTRSTPGTFCGCSRSTRSTRRPARATAAPSSTGDRRLHRAVHRMRCRPIRSAS